MMPPPKNPKQRNYEPLIYRAAEQLPAPRPVRALGFSGFEGSSGSKSLGALRVWVDTQDLQKDFHDFSQEQRQAGRVAP